MSEWIRVADGLPSKHMTVIVSWFAHDCPECSHRSVAPARYGSWTERRGSEIIVHSRAGFTTLHDNGPFAQPITHWLPLPEPPV